MLEFGSGGLPAGAGPYRHALPCAAVISLCAAASERAGESAAFSVLHHHDGDKSYTNKDVKNA